MIKIVSKALIKNKNGKYLLLYRGDTHPNFPGHLDLPGGEVESEETSKTATAREVQEETGICIYPNGLKKLFAKQHKSLSPDYRASQTINNSRQLSTRHL